MRSFTPLHHGGSGSPLLLLHGFTDTWAVWEPVLEILERSREVLAPTLPGHAGGPQLDRITATTMVEAVERALDDAGWDEPVAVAGNSLGGHVALQLAARGRAASVVALAPAGGWDGEDPSRAPILALLDGVRAAAPHADAIAARTATAHVPADLVAHQIMGAARCESARLLAFARDADWPLDADAIACPVRIVWGTADELLPWPAAAARYRRDFWHADWVELGGIGHRPQLEAPVETAQLIVGFPSPAAAS